MEIGHSIRSFGAVAALTFTASLPVAAASVSVSPSASSTVIGGGTTLDLFLNLDPGETASIFEGKFGIGGLGSIASVSIDATGPTWSSAASNLAGGNALLSLTSNNIATASRLLATLTFTGLSVGVSNVTFSADTFAAFDIATPPFSRNLSLSNLDGQVLASVAVVPEPSTVASLLLGLGAIGALRRRRRLAGAVALLGASLSPLAQAAEVANVPDSMRARLSTSSVGLTEQFGVTGRLVRLQGRFQSLSVAHTQADGQVDVNCLGPGNESIRALDKIEAPGPANRSTPAAK